MFMGIINALKRIGSHLSSWVSGASTAVGLVSGVSETKLILPSYVWWVVAVGAIFFTAIRIQMELDEEKKKRRKPQPSVPLQTLIERIVGDSNWGATGVPQKTSDTLVAIREKARLGVLSAWGRNGANQSHLSFYPLEPIPEQHWTNAHIDYLEFLKDSKCATTNAKHPGSPNHYSDIHFDSVEVEAAWPTKKRPKFKWQSPLVRAG
jgi:hypothetical protein